ncbi:MAG: class II aldolase/adducin family protein [Clostridiales bacterium]|nr:class II aldolase/adducin family protein [Clostridiales bacterium]
MGTDMDMEMDMDLKALVEMSRKYGADPEYVLAGGGNTSCKEGGVMAVKASGAALAEIDEDGFVLMDTGRLRALTDSVYPGGDDEREACAVRDMMAARLEGQGEKRPSVECILHALFPQKYVLHVHPALINGLTCGRKGAKAAAELFEDMKDRFLWVPLIKPGYVLSKACAEAFGRHNNDYGQYPSIVLLQNHGIFVAADDTEEVDKVIEDAVLRVLAGVSKTKGDGSSVLQRAPGSENRPRFAAPDSENSPRFAAPGSENRPRFAAPGSEYRPRFAALYGGVSKYLVNDEIARFVSGREAYGPLSRPFTPDHIVYCRAYPLFIEDEKNIEESFSLYEEKHGYKPKIVAVKGDGVFALGKDENEAAKAAELFWDAVKVAIYSESFGGPLHLPDEFTEFIVNWEIESYRQKQSFGK